MAEERIIIEKEPSIQYIRFGTCRNCGTKMAIKGKKYEIKHYIELQCKNCKKFRSVPLGFLHKANSRYAKRKLRKAEKNESKD